MNIVHEQVLVLFVIYKIEKCSLFFAKIKNKKSNPWNVMPAKGLEVLTNFNKINLEVLPLPLYLCASSLTIHLSRKAEGNGPLKP
jgi:hypothetical protein